jgi:hypothetical protein
MLPAKILFAVAVINLMFLFTELTINVLRVHFG